MENLLHPWIEGEAVSNDVVIVVADKIDETNGIFGEVAQRFGGLGLWFQMQELVAENLASLKRPVVLVLQRSSHEMVITITVPAFIAACSV